MAASGCAGSAAAAAAGAGACSGEILSFCLSQPQQQQSADHRHCCNAFACNNKWLLARLARHQNRVQLSLFRSLRQKSECVSAEVKTEQTVC